MILILLLLILIPIVLSGIYTYNKTSDFLYSEFKASTTETLDLANIKIGQNGYVFVTDSKGIMMAHRDNKLLGGENSLFSFTEAKNISLIFFTPRLDIC